MPDQQKIVQQKIVQQPEKLSRLNKLVDIKPSKVIERM